MFYELQKKLDGVWKHEGYYQTYEQLQKDFIHRDGLFRSQKRYFKDKQM